MQITRRNNIPDNDRFDALLHHIEIGIDLLKADEGMKAYRHLLSVRGYQVEVGRSVAYQEILTEEQLVKAASTVARNSRANTGCAEIGGWHLGGWMSDEIDETKFRPDLVHQLEHEGGVVAAEELLHIAQYCGDVSLAGHADKEADVAVFLDTQGVQLSADFLTRYRVRADWYKNEHPERSDDLNSFLDTHQRRML